MFNRHVLHWQNVNGKYVNGKLYQILALMGSKRGHRTYIVRLFLERLLLWLVFVISEIGSNYLIEHIQHLVNSVILSKCLIEEDKWCNLNTNLYFPFSFIIHRINWGKCHLQINFYRVPFIFDNKPPST